MGSLCQPVALKLPKCFLTTSKPPREEDLEAHRACAPCPDVPADNNMAASLQLGRRGILFGLRFNLIKQCPRTTTPWRAQARTLHRCPALLGELLGPRGRAGGCFYTAAGARCAPLAATPADTTLRCSLYSRFIYGVVLIIALDQGGGEAMRAALCVMVVVIICINSKSDAEVSSVDAGLI